MRLPPLFWYETRPAQDTRFLMAALLFWRGRDARGGFDVVAPLYYRSRTDDEFFRILLPLHFRYRVKDADASLWGPLFQRDTARDRLRAVFPLYLHWLPKQAGETSFQALLPFYLRLEDGRSRSYFSPLFYSYRDALVSYGLVPPYFWRHTADSKTQVGFPLYWRFRRKGAEGARDVQVAGPWFRVETGSQTVRSLFPVYWGRTRSLREDEIGAVVPRPEWNLWIGLFFHSLNPDGSSRLVTPLFSRFRGADGTRSGHSGLHFFRQDPWGGRSEGLFPLLHYRQEPDFFRLRLLNVLLRRDLSGDHTLTAMFPFFSYQKDADRRQFLTPFFYSDRDPDLSRGFALNYFWRTDLLPVQPGAPPLHKRVFFPFFWHFHSETGRTTVAAPFLAWHEREGVRFSLALPFYFSRLKGEDRLRIVLPYMERASPGKSWRSLFFLYWRTDKPERRSLTLLPLLRRSVFPGGDSLYLPGFYRLRQGSESQGVLGPYLWDGRGPTRYRILPPVLFDFRRPSWEIRSRLLFYEFKNRSVREKGFFPLIARTEGVDASTAAKHFLADSHRALPFYFYRRLEDGRDLWMPILLARFYRRMKEGEEWVQGRFLLLSYWERSPRHRVRRLDPLFSYYENPDTLAFTAPTAPFPLWQYRALNRKDAKQRTVTGAFFPYYWKEALAFRRDFLFPLYYRSRRMSEDGKEELGRKTWLLLYYAAGDKEKRKSVRLFAPLMLSLERGDEKFSVFFPLFYSSEDAARSKRTLFILPAFWSARDAETSSRLIGPYYARDHGRKRERVRLLAPLYFSIRSPARTALTFFPLYWKLSSEDRSISYFFPLYLRHKRRDLDWKVAFPVFWRLRTPEIRLTVVPPYYAIEATDTRVRTVGFAPLWTYTADAVSAESNFQVLGGLVGLRRRPGWREWTFFYLLKI